ncbi:MAG: helix-turn-helix domain-containing protein [Candidatus Thorarchaeota archaeon]
MAKQRRMEQARKRRRDAIIDTAERFFIQHGYEDTMVNKIAEEAGYTKATIYNYFESKDDLFVAVSARVFERLHQTFTEFMFRSDVTYELRTMGDAYLGFVEKYPEQASIFEQGQLSLVITRVVMKEETQEELTESESELRHHQMEIQRLMTDIITQTMKKSGVTGKVDPMSVIMALSTLSSSIRELVMRGKRTSAPEEKTKEYLDVLFNIIDQGLKHYDAK